MQVGGRTSWPVSRILFRAAMTGGAAATIHLDTPSPGASSGLPAGSGEQPSNVCAAATRLRPSWPCFGWGLPSHPGHPECWCALTAPFHPYLPRGPKAKGWRSVFCGTFPRVTSDCRWQSPCSVKSGLSSTPRQTWAPRPPGQLVRADHRTLRLVVGPSPARPSAGTRQRPSRGERRIGIRPRSVRP